MNMAKQFDTGSTTTDTGSTTTRETDEVTLGELCLVYLIITHLCYERFKESFGQAHEAVEAAEGVKEKKA
jgi:hypothetical protein